MSVAELATRVKLSDPKPARCAACWQSADADLRFVDFDAAIDRGAFISENAGAVIDSIDELHICEPCIRSACEALDMRPEHVQLLLREARDANRRADEWKAYAQRLEQAQGARPEPPEDA